MMILSPEVRQARSQVLADALSGGEIRLYTAPVAATGEAITTQTLLAAFAIPEGLAPVGTTLTLPLSTITLGVEGEAAWGRIVNAEDEWVLDGDCGLVDSTAFFRLKTTYFSVGANLIPLTATLAEG
jgi:hypothetical protein